MEAETQSINKEKIIQTVDKYTNLIKEDRVYEFTQKIQLLTHRKQQSKKYQQAEFLLVCALEKLFTLSPQQKTESYTLLDHLLKIYDTHPQIWNLQKGKKLYEILNIKQTTRKYEYYVRFLKTLKNKPFPRDLLLDLIAFYLSKDQFTKAESHALQLDLPFVKNFLEKWCSKVSSEEATAIQCRLALLRGLFSNFQECEELLDGVDRESPFFKFTNFLISASKLKSKEAYEMLGSRYKPFLQSDEMFNKIYQGYGSYFFKINPTKGNSFMSLFN